MVVVYSSPVHVCLYRAWYINKLYTWHLYVPVPVIKSLFVVDYGAYSWGVVTFLLQGVQPLNQILYFYLPIAGSSAPLNFPFHCLQTLPYTTWWSSLWKLYKMHLSSMPMSGGVCEIVTRTACVVSNQISFRRIGFTITMEILMLEAQSELHSSTLIWSIILGTAPEGNVTAASHHTAYWSPNIPIWNQSLCNSMVIINGIHKG